MSEFLCVVAYGMIGIATAMDFIDCCESKDWSLLDIALLIALWPALWLFRFLRMSRKR